MAFFTTRVELHYADDDDYDTLHDAMKEQGFSRTIKLGDVTYHLPTAEYNFSGEFTKEQVLSKAKSAASKTGNSYAVLVTEAVLPRVQFGLLKKS